MGQAQPQSAPAVQGAPTGSTPAGPGAASPPRAPQAAPSADPYQPAIDKVNGLLQSGQIPLQMGTSYVKTLQEMQTNANTSKAKVAELDKANQDLKDAKQKYDEKEGELAAGALQVARKTGYDPQNGWDPDAVHAALTGVGLMHPDDPDLQAKVANINNQIAQHPDPAQRNALLDQLYIQTGAQKADLEQSKGEQEVQGAKFKNAAEERAQATQDLQAAGSDPSQLQSWKQQYPDIAKNVNTSDPASIQRFLASSVPVKEQPDYQIKLKQADFMQNLTPKSLSDLVDQTVPPTGSTAAANKQIKAEATAAVSMGGDANAIRAVIDKGVEAVRAQGLQVGAKQMEAGTQLSIAAQNRAAQQGFQSYTQNNSELDKIGNPIEQTAQKVADIKDLMAENSPQAWANIPAKVLSLTAGGTGSGLRMNQALLDKELGGAGKWAELQGKFQAWNPNSAKASEISDAQKAQFKSVVASLEKQIQARLDVVNGARTDLLGAGNDVNQHRKIVLGVHQKLQGLDQQAGQAGQSGAPKPVPGAVSAALSKVGPGIHKLSDGSSWKKAADGTLTPQ